MRSPGEGGRDDELLEALRAVPRGIRAVRVKRTRNGRVEYELVSGLDEPVGVVAGVKGAGSILLTRGAAVVGIDADSDGVIKLARHVATAGQGGDPDDARGMHRVIIRSDAVDVIVQAVRSARV